MTAVQNERETYLAWALIEAAKPHMSVGERNFVFVTVGAGDTFAAIRSLVNLLAAKRIPLRPQVVQLCRTWLDGYTAHDEHEHLRGIIEGFLMPHAIQAHTALRRLPARPKHLPLPVVSRN
ncbi:hypothetical protein [Mycobacterium sp. URHB0044]|uniref:hypothetical protein n=1 Tax=Mycobacterium sp. URHB0044 TaxID=1380386 RepID=UPI0006854375|nr:hypothetical protein [Mycobacterium sp. URHB0044]